LVGLELKEDPPLPDLRILDPAPGHHYANKYRFEGHITKDSIIAFVRDFKGGKLVAY